MRSAPLATWRLERLVLRAPAPASGAHPQRKTSHGCVEAPAGARGGHSAEGEGKGGAICSPRVIAYVFWRRGSWRLHRNPATTGRACRRRWRRRRNFPARSTAASSRASQLKTAELDVWLRLRTGDWPAAPTARTPILGETSSKSGTWPTGANCCASTSAANGVGWRSRPAARRQRPGPTTLPLDPIGAAETALQAATPFNYITITTLFSSTSRWDFVLFCCLT